MCETVIVDTYEKEKDKMSGTGHKHIQTLS